MSLQVDQVLAGFAPYDAISQEAINIRGLLQRWGYASRILVPSEFIDPILSDLCLPLSRESVLDSDCLIYHFSIGSWLSELVSEFQRPKMLIYHNITPGHYFRPYNPEVSRQLDQGRAQLAEMSGSFQVALADSDYNCRELRALGYGEAHVLPILLNRDQLSTRGPLPRLPFLRQGFKTLLFVGRLAPNKKAEDLVRIFGLFNRYHNPRSRLVWVGSWNASRSYYYQVANMAAELDVPNVVFAGSLSHRELMACYQRADVFVSASEHEGFCVPLLESFCHQTPVIARASAAVPETVGPAGLLLPGDDFFLFAQAIDRVLTDQNLRDYLIGQGVHRLETHFSFDRVARILRQHLARLLSAS